MSAQTMARRGWFLLLLPVLILGLRQSGCSKPSSESQYDVVLVYTVPHEAINQIIAGFREELPNALAGIPFEISEQHASGDCTQFSATVTAALARRPDLLVTITTPIAQIALSEKPTDVPMVFLAVTDPVGAGLVESFQKPGRCTGVSDLAPFEAVLRFAQETQPAARSIGLPFSPEEQPAVFGRDEIVRLAMGRRLTIDARPVTSKDELSIILTTLVGSCDALLIGSDNGMFEAAPLIVRTAMDVKKPVFAGDSTSIKAGAIGGYTIDYSAVGQEGARVAARILNGEDAGTIPVTVMRDGVLELNRESASRLGIKLTAEMLARAKRVYPE